MYTSYHLVQTLDSYYFHRNILNVIMYGSQCDIIRKSRFIKIIHILWLPWQHRTLYLNTCNHYLRVRKHFTKAKHVGLFYMYTV